MMYILDDQTVHRTACNAHCVIEHTDRVQMRAHRLRASERHREREIIRKRPIPNSATPDDTQLRNQLFLITPLHRSIDVDRTNERPKERHRETAKQREI